MYKCALLNKAWSGVIYYSEFYIRGLSNKQLLQVPQSRPKCVGETVSVIVPGTSNKISAFSVSG